MIEDYKKYLSVDNGHGILLSHDDVRILRQYHIDIYQFFHLKELIMRVEECLDEDYDEELELVLEHLSEVYYYQEVNK